MLYTQLAGRGHLPQISPSCSEHPPAWWSHSCWSPGPSHPSPSLPECCGPAGNKTQWVSLSSIWRGCIWNTVGSTHGFAFVDKKWKHKMSGVSYCRTKWNNNGLDRNLKILSDLMQCSFLETKTLCFKYSALKDSWAFPTLSTWKIKSSSQTFSKHLSSVSTNT